MHLSDNTLILSATDLSKFQSCGHLTLLDRLTALGLQPKPPKYDDPPLDLLFACRLQHEQAYVEALNQKGGINSGNIGSKSGNRHQRGFGCFDLRLLVEFIRLPK